MAFEAAICITGWISRFKIRHGDDDNADEERLRLAECVFGVKFIDYISIDPDVETCGILNIEEMYDNTKNKNNSEKLEDKVQADEVEPIPVPSLSDAMTEFETIRAFIYTHEITEKDQKKKL
ncbi:hypothetical protein NPIL_81371 [Nephila pilipes]|uniref:Uncharacterized protein n=1 Tax=Nephila pilipes TaxID=299642 RepID=A0A8X6QB80_NEPPI|nr:hypothetical protein NPIL_81371 [Nephila pilipes]